MKGELANPGSRRIAIKPTCSLCVFTMSSLCKCCYYSNGVMVTVLDLQSRGRGFDSQPFHFHVMTPCKLFARVQTPRSIIWYRPKGGDAALWMRR